MADTRYVEQTLYELERALNDLAALGLLPEEAARAVMETAVIHMERRAAGSQEVDHGGHPDDESL